MVKENQRIRTEASETQMAQAIMEAWNDLFHSMPSKEQVSLILAQNALETGGRKSMWNNNVGNIKASTSGPYDYFYLRGPEQTSPGHWEQLRMAFRSYPTLKEGVKDYLNLLSKNKRYASAWSHIQNPDPVAFSKALKEGGYYTGNESDYTRNVSQLYNKFNKSQSYEVAKNTGNSEENEIDNYMKQQDDKNIWDQIGMSGQQSQAPQAANFDSLLDQYVGEAAKEVAATNKKNKKFYKQYLPEQNVLIRVQGSQHVNSIEFARILCAALDEELIASAFTYTDGNSVEVECSINGPELLCFNAVKQLTASLAEAFKTATTKIGGLEVKTYCFMNKKSSYQQISLTAASNQHRNFLLKFI